MTAPRSTALDPPQVGPSTMTTEESAWWERERKHLLMQVMDDRVDAHVDVGCGRGGIAAELADRGSFVVAVDMHPYDEWRNHPNVAFVRANIDQLPFRAGAFDRLSVLDVIEHVDDDQAVLSELRRVSTDSGRLVVTVPADPRLWSAHDEAVGHHRRYDATTLDARTRQAGFEPLRASHFFAWLYAPAWLLRNRRHAVARSEGGRLGAWSARLLGVIERGWLRRFRLPFGTSLLLEAEAGPRATAGRERS
jgi:SAM-dependent methyltransferase